jgi:hypothetical protein
MLSFRSIFTCFSIVLAAVYKEREPSAVKLCNVSGRSLGLPVMSASTAWPLLSRIIYIYIRVYTLIRAEVALSPKWLDTGWTTRELIPARGRDSSLCSGVQSGSEAHYGYGVWNWPLILIKLRVKNACRFTTIPPYVFKALCLSRGADLLLVRRL